MVKWNSKKFEWIAYFRVWGFFPVVPGKRQKAEINQFLGGGGLRRADTQTCHASVLRTHSNTQAVLELHCMSMFAVIFRWVCPPCAAKLGEGPPAEPHHEVFSLKLLQFCCAEPWEFRAEVFAEVFLLWMSQQNKAENFVENFAANFAPNCPPPKRKLRPKLRSAETHC